MRIDQDERAIGTKARVSDGHAWTMRSRRSDPTHEAGNNQETRIGKHALLACAEDAAGVRLHPNRLRAIEPRWVATAITDEQPATAPTAIDADLDRMHAR